MPSDPPPAGPAALFTAVAPWDTYGMSATSAPVRQSHAPHRVNDPWHHILVATDGTSASLAPTSRALELACRDRADLTIVVVHPAGPRGEPSHAGGGITVLQPLLEQARAAGVRVSVEERCGPTGQTIVDLAREMDADLIVVGRHGRLHDLPSGTATCGYVLTHSDRPVLVVQPWAPDAARGGPVR